MAGGEELKTDIEQEKMEKGESVDEVKEWGEKKPKVRLTLWTMTSNS